MAENLKSDLSEMDKMFLPPGFIDTYIPFIIRLLEVSPTERTDIYKYSVEYFEAKLKEREKRSVSKRKRTSESEGKERDISSGAAKDSVKPDFSYDSILEQYPEILVQKRSDAEDSAQNNERMETPAKMHGTAKGSAGSSENKEHSSNELLKHMTEFSKLLPGYIEVMADFLDKLADEKRESSTSEKEEQEMEDQFPVAKRHRERDNGKNARVPRESSKSMERENKGIIQKRHRSVHSQTKLTGDMECRKCRTNTVDLSSATELATFSYVRSIMVTASSVMQFIHLGVENHFITESKEIIAKTCEEEAISVPHTACVFASLENCLGSVKSTKQYVTDPNFWASAETLTAIKERRDTSVQTVDDILGNLESSPTEDTGKHSLDANILIEKTIVGILDETGTDEMSPIEDERMCSFDAQTSELKPTMNSSDEPDEYSTESPRNGKLSSKFEASDDNNGLLKKSSSSDELFIPRKDKKPKHSQKITFSKESNQKSAGANTTPCIRRTLDCGKDNRKCPEVPQKEYHDVDPVGRKVPQKDTGTTEDSGAPLASSPYPGNIHAQHVSFGFTTVVNQQMMKVRTQGDSEDTFHSDFQTTFLMQSRINKIKAQYKLKSTKSGIALLEKGQPAVILDSGGIPMTGRSWVRTFFMARMMARCQKAFELEDSDADEFAEDLGVPMLKHVEYNCGYRTYFNQPGIFSAIRIWYFRQKFREYEKQSHRS